MRSAGNIFFVPRLTFARLSSKEMSLFCEYVSKRNHIPSDLHRRMQDEIERQSTLQIKLRLPPGGQTGNKHRRVWRSLIRGPIGGWEQKGKRILRKWDPAARRIKLSFALLLEPRQRKRASFIYEGNLFEWWICRAVITGQIRQFFECWYCGNVAWGQRSGARFCNDRCRMRYHLAQRNQNRLRRLPPGQRRRAYWAMKEKGAEVGLIDMPIAQKP